MKSVLLTLAFVVSGLTASAASIDQTNVIAVVTGAQSGISSVALLADGRLQIQDQAGKVKTIVLSKAVVEDLKNEAQSVANIEITEENRRVVCAMMPIMRLSDIEVGSFDFATGKFSAARRLILSANNCALSHVVFPKEQYALIAASELRKALVILALNTVK